jgi:anti-sigma B factor antagonist
VTNAGHGPGDSDLLTVDVEHEPGAAQAIVRVAGEVDTLSVGELAAALERVVAAGVTEVRLDLSAVPFMDSSGLTALITARTQLEGRGRVLVDQASSAVRRTFEVAGLDVFFGTA